MQLKSRVFVQRERPTVDGPVLETLFAVAWETHRTRGGRLVVVDCGVDYMHAESAGHARFQFWQALTPAEKKGRHVVNIAPAVGFNVHDNHGDKLSA
jgi:hypothetical protein